MEADWIDERLSCTRRLAASPPFSCPGCSRRCRLAGCRPPSASLDAVEGCVLTHLPTRAYCLGGLSDQPAGWSGHATREQTFAYCTY